MTPSDAGAGDVTSLHPDSGEHISTGAAHLTHADSRDIGHRFAAIELANHVQRWCEGSFRDGVPFAEVTAMFDAKIAALRASPTTETTNGK